MKMHEIAIITGKKLNLIVNLAVERKKRGKEKMPVSEIEKVTIF